MIDMYIVMSDGDVEGANRRLAAVRTTWAFAKSSSSFGHRNFEM